MTTIRRTTVALATAAACTVGAFGPAAITPASAAGVAPGPAAPPSPSTAGGDLPDGWSVETTPSGRTQLRYESDAEIPTKSAELTIRNDAGLTVPARTTPAGDVVAPLQAPLTTTKGLAVYSGETPVAELSTPTKRATTIPKAIPTTLKPRFKTVSADYRVGSVDLPDLKAKTPLTGHVVAPVGAPRTRPLVLFLHGRHDSCYKGERLANAYPCPKGFTSLPSHRGYDYAQRALAAQGYVTVSVDANAVNALDEDALDLGNRSRSEIVRAHLRQLSTWATSGTVPWRGKGASPYTTRSTLLVGHSRGGDGVSRAAIDSRISDPWRVKGVVNVAPTDFFQQSHPTVPTTTLLPSCDGDVLDHQGQRFTDGIATWGQGAQLHTSIRVPGANHNFFNTEWTPGLSVASSDDDSRGTECTAKGRLSPAKQQESLVATVNASARSYIYNSSAATSELDGTTARFSGTTLTNLAAVPSGGRRTLLWSGFAGTTAAPALGRTGLATWCPDASCSRARTIDEPHWLTGDARSGHGLQIAAARGKSGGIRLAQPTAISKTGKLEARVVVRSGTATLRARLTDASGRSAWASTERGTTLRRLSGADEGSRTRMWGQLWRAKLPTGIDLSKITRIDWVAQGGPIDVVVLDTAVVDSLARISTRGSGPVLDLKSPMAVDEGSGRHHISVPLSLRGRLSAPVQVGLTRVDDQGEEQSETTWTTIKPGQAPVGRLVIKGNTIDDQLLRTYRTVLSVRGPAIAGQATSAVTVKDDDADPVVTVTPTASASPGGTLRWTVSIDRPSNDFIGVRVVAIPTTSGPALRVGDLSEQGRGLWGIYDAKRDSSVATAKASMSVNLGKTPDGTTRSTTIDMPLATSITGRPRTVKLKATIDGPKAGPFTLTGTVR